MHAVSGILSSKSCTIRSTKRVPHPEPSSQRHVDRPCLEPPLHAFLCRGAIRVRRRPTIPVFVVTIDSFLVGNTSQSAVINRHPPQFLFESNNLLIFCRHHYTAACILLRRRCRPRPRCAFVQEPTTTLPPRALSTAAACNTRQSNIFARSSIAANNKHWLPFGCQ
jgi:hypothetical protein